MHTSEVFSGTGGHSLATSRPLIPTSETNFRSPRGKSAMEGRKKRVRHGSTFSDVLRQSRRLDLRLFFKDFATFSGRSKALLGALMVLCTLFARRLILRAQSPPREQVRARPPDRQPVYPARGSRACSKLLSALKVALQCKYGSCAFVECSRVLQTFFIVRGEEGKHHKTTKHFAGAAQPELQKPPIKSAG